MSYTTIYIGKALYQQEYNAQLKRIYAKALNKAENKVLLNDIAEDFYLVNEQ